MKELALKERGIIGSGDGSKEKLYKTEDGKYILRGIGDRGVKTGFFETTGFTHTGKILVKELDKRQASIWAETSNMPASDWMKEFA